MTDASISQLEEDKATEMLKIKIKAMYKIEKMLKDQYY
jgi:hypothetical protein